jgi:hypothetical protein
VTGNVDRLSAVQRAEANDMLQALKQCDITVVNLGSRLTDSEKATMALVSGFCCSNNTPYFFDIPRSVLRRTAAEF